MRRWSFIRHVSNGAVLRWLQQVADGAGVVAARLGASTGSLDDCGIIAHIVDHPNEAIVQDGDLDAKDSVEFRHLRP